jgi:hypothetical protein
VWDGSAWRTPATLTDNEVLDHAPLLAQGNDGTLFLAWRRSGDGELVGTAAHPESFVCALWDGGTWSEPAPLPLDSTGVLGITAARHDAATMALVYSRDTDGDLSTAADQELYRVTWNGSAWVGPVRLTDDAQADSSPVLFYTADGQPRLAWLKGDTLCALLDGWAGTPQAVSATGSAAVLDFGAAQDGGGNLVLLWQGYAGQGVDLFYAAYDDEHDVFSNVEQLTSDAALEKFAAPAFASSGELWMAYNKTALISETVTLSPTLVISSVTDFGQTDLYVLRHTLGPDLALTGLSVSPANPAPGSAAQIEAEVHNLGDRAVARPAVSFYLGDPQAGGTLIGSAVSGITLTGKATTTLSTTWPVPPSGGPFALYARADPSGAVDELDEDNNDAHLWTSVPDLAISDLEVSYGSDQTVTLTARLRNEGVVAASPAEVVFRRDDPDAGDLVASWSTPSLASGVGQEIEVTWDVSSVPAGSHPIYALADFSGSLAEADEANNQDTAEVGVLPDLALDPTTLYTATLPSGGTVVNVWVYNRGLRDAEDALLGAYDRLPETGVAPVVETTVDLAASSYRVVTLDLSHAPWLGFYIAVGADGETPDRNPTNNTLVLGLPLDRRVYAPAVLNRYAGLAP